MPWSEAVDLVKILRADPSSAIAAAIEGWEYPIDRVTLAVLDLFDAFVSANSDPKKGEPEPHGGRPWPTNRRTETRRGDVRGQTVEHVKELLRKARAGELELRDK